MDLNATTEPENAFFFLYSSVSIRFCLRCGPLKIASISDLPFSLTHTQVTQERALLIIILVLALACHVNFNFVLIFRFPGKLSEINIAPVCRQKFEY